MRVIYKKSIKIDETCTIQKRIVRLEDGSNMYQIHVSTDPKFNTYTATTFADLMSASKIYGQP